jgi:N-acetylmuramic acid 6-phosphate etherase
MNTSPDPQPLPPDRSWVLTEQRNPRTTNLHEMDIAQIVRTIREEDAAVLSALQVAQIPLTTLIAAIEPGFASGGRLVTLGAGTSGRLAVLDASEMPPTFHVEHGRFVGIIAGGDSALRVSSEGKEDDADGARAELEKLGLCARDGVIGVAAGGTTPYVRGALSIAKSLAPGCVTGMISCSPVDAPPGCDHLVVLPTGPEVVTGSTRMKAGTATKLALNTISTALMVRTGRVYENLMVDLKASNDKLRDRAARIVSTLTGVDRSAAFALVDAAGGSVKAAVVMQRRGVGREEAERLLVGAGGHLARVLDEVG